MLDVLAGRETDPSDAASPRHYLRRTLRILALVVLGAYALVQAKTLLVPLAFAAVVAMLFAGPVDRLSARMPRGLAIGLVVGALAVVVAGLFFLAGRQAASFAGDLPRVREQATLLVERAQDWVAARANIDAERVEERMSEQLSGAADSAVDRASSWAGNLLGFLADLLLFFVYLVVLLAQRDRLREFVIAKAPHRDEGKARRALTQVGQVAGQYVKGRALLIAILFGVYAAGFWFAGLEYALVVAGVAALMSVVPYAGNLAAAFLVLAVAGFSGDGFGQTAAIALGTMALAQVLESYVLMPLVVGSEVDLNPLATIVAVVAFGLVWGVPGAILALPIAAIAKEVLKVVPNGRPWAHLLADERLVREDPAV